MSTIKGFDEIPVYEEFLQDPNLDAALSVAEAAHKYGPIFKHKLEYQPGLSEWHVFLVGPEANRFALLSHRENFSHDIGWTPLIGDLFPKGLLNTDDPEHARQRKIMNPAFSVAYMNRYLPIMQRVIADRTRDWAERGVVDVNEETRKITFDVAAEALVGFQTGAEVDRLRELFYALVGPDFTSQTEMEWWQRISTVRNELTVMLIKMIAERRAQPTDDILGILVNTRDENGLTFSDEELLGQLNILLIAGHETTTTMSAWLLYLLASHPDYLKRIQTELASTLRTADGEVTLDSLKNMHLLGNAVNEAGRLYPPVFHAPRGVLKDFEFGGYHVPAGSIVRVELAATHFLPEVFSNPKQFDPDRFAPPREEDKRTPYSLVTFGGGPRICIGINFAQIEMRALAAHVLSNFSLEPVEGQSLVNHYYNGITASLPDGLFIRVRKLDTNN